MYENQDIGWELVKEWLERRGYISDRWERVEVDDCGIYCADTMENTFISLFINGGFLVCFVGCIKPKVYAGGDTDCRCSHYCDVINYLDDELENLFDALERKI
jgi:hypothetical protein